MTKKLPARFASWEDADAAFDRFVESLPERREQLRQRLAATGGPELDGSLESLTPLMRWYYSVALQDVEDGMDWWPEWLPPHDPTFQLNDEYPRRLSPQFVRLWELVGVYIGDVAQPLVPHARWVCWRSKAARELTAGAFVLDFGDALFPFAALAAANRNLSMWYIQHGSGGYYDKPLDPDVIEPGLRNRIVERDTLRKDRPLTWQKAPTGPDAFRRTSKPDW